MAEALQRIKAFSGRIQILVRIVDHACHSQHCISHRVAVMCQQAAWKTSQDLCDDQPLDACGYIAADAVCRLREAALAKANDWHHMTLPNYARQECIDRGNKVLGRSDLGRILDSDQVNRLVRHYSHLDQTRQAAEDWWAGAVALDHFLIGLPGMVEELATDISGQQHRWRAWVVNTQTSAQLGSHWFTVIAGTAVANVPQLIQSFERASTVASAPQLLQSTAAASSMPDAPQLLQSTAASSAMGKKLTKSSGSGRADVGSPSLDMAEYPNLFDSPDPALSDVLLWAHANAMLAPVESWLNACSQWDAAVNTNSGQKQVWVVTDRKRRKLCKDHDIAFTREFLSSDTMDAAIEQVRQALINRIQQIRTTATRKILPGKLENYFKPIAAGKSLPEIEPLDIPDVATDVTSTFLRLHTKSNIYAEDEDFRIVKDALSVLRNQVNKARLLKMTRVPRGKPKTVRRYFKPRNFAIVSFSSSPSPAEAAGGQQPKQERATFNTSLAWKSYYVKVLVLAQARQWLSATERLDPIADAPPTPKTNFQLADAIKQRKHAEYAPFGKDFEDTGAYSPIISRLLVYAEIHNCSDHAYGTFSTPQQMMPYTYRQLQDWIVERRRLQQQSDAAESSSQELVQTVEDLAAKLQAFAADAIVLKHLIEFALPPPKRATAAELTSKVPPATSGSGSNGRSAATERPAATDDATEHAREIESHDPQEDNQRQAIRAATEPATQGADGHDVTLSLHTATAMAKNFFSFVKKECLQQHLSRMSAGQILVLCIFHNRLLWQKGKPLELHDRDHYWIPKPAYAPASNVKAPSPAHFVKQIQRSATEQLPPEMQPPRRCCLCGKGFIDAPALWNHCELEHYSWAEAVKRILWEADKLDAMPLLPPYKRQIIQNFADALTYSKPAESHFGRDKVCMKQRVGCATCAKVSWIDRCFPCHLFQDCPDVLRPKNENHADDTETDDAESNEDSSNEDVSATEQRPARLLKDEHGFYVMDAHAINELLDVNKYIEAWPQIPKEELHASSVQHPSHPTYRWLLNTRRVPVQASSSDSAAADHELPKCAGVGIKHQPLWLCKSCTSALCRPEPVMPFFALSNWNWGGRLHPLYYNLSIATKALLGLAIMLCRLLVLQHSEHEEDQEKGFVGNTILLTQPRPEEILQTLPPEDAEVSKYISVCFNNQSILFNRKSEPNLTLRGKSCVTLPGRLRGGLAQRSCVTSCVTLHGRLARPSVEALRDLA